LVRSLYRSSNRELFRSIGRDIASIGY
jgi:hypothetical protein